MERKPKKKIQQKTKTKPNPTRTRKESYKQILTLDICILKPRGQLFLISRSHCCSTDTGTTTRVAFDG